MGYWRIASTNSPSLVRERGQVQRKVGASRTVPVSQLLRCPGHNASAQGEFQDTSGMVLAGAVESGASEEVRLGYSVLAYILPCASLKLALLSWEGPMQPLTLLPWAGTMGDESPVTTLNTWTIARLTLKRWAASKGRPLGLLISGTYAGNLGFCCSQTSPRHRHQQEPGGGGSI